MQESQPPDIRQALHILSQLALLADMAVLASVGYLILFLRPNMMRILEDFDTQLPVMTQLVMSIPTAAYLAGLLIVAAALVTKEVLAAHPGVKLAANLVVGLFVLAIEALIYLALFLPIAELMQQLS